MDNARRTGAATCAYCQNEMMISLNFDSFLQLSQVDQSRVPDR